MIFSYRANKKVIDGKIISIYGINYESLEIFFYCLQLDISVKHFVVDNSEIESAFFRKVIKKDEYFKRFNKDDVLIVPDNVDCGYLGDEGKILQLKDILLSNTNKYNTTEVIDTLKYNKKLLLSDGKMLSKTSVFDIVKSKYEGKQFFVIGTDAHINIMKKIFEFLNIRCIYGNIKDCFEEIKSYHTQYEILYYDNLDLNLYEKLRLIGYIKGQNIKSFLTYRMEEVYDRDVVMDVNLGYSYRYGMYEKYAGFKEYGNYKNAKFKIVALGNSTTDAGEQEVDESWPYYLFKELDKMYPNQIAILNGGVAGYNISQEFVKFIRDVSILKPNIAISYSGCINIAHKRKEKSEFIPTYQNLLYNLTTVIDNDNLVFANIDRDKKCFGISFEGSKYEYFVSQAKMFHAAAQAIGIPWYCIVQPMLYTKNTLSHKEKEKLIYYHSTHIYEQTKQFVDSFKSDENKDSWLYDFTEIFDNFDNIYKDLYHVFGFANKIVAQEVEKQIIRKILSPENY